VFSGGAGAGLIRAFLELCEFSPGVASVLSDGRMAGLVSPAFRDRFAVSINWGANFLRGRSSVGGDDSVVSVGDVPVCGSSLKVRPSSSFPIFFWLLLVVVSTGWGLNFPRVLLADSAVGLFPLLLTDVGIGSGVNLRLVLVFVSTGSGRNLRETFVMVSAGSAAAFLDDFVLVSIGSGLNRLGGVDVAMA
jgi:hypothetical protein